MKKFFVDPKTGKIRKFRTALVVLIGLVIVGIAIGDDTETPSVSESQKEVQAEKSESKEERPKKQKVAKIGDTVVAGKLAYTVEKVEEKKVLKNALGEKRPGSGKFLILTVTIENRDNEGRSISEAMTKLVDKEGNEYEPDASAFMYMETTTGNSSMFDNINPKGKKTFHFVYDVSGKAEDYTFVGTGGFDLLDNGEARIALKK